MSEGAELRSSIRVNKGVPPVRLGIDHEPGQQILLDPEAKSMKAQPNKNMSPSSETDCHHEKIYQMAKEHWSNANRITRDIMDTTDAEKMKEAREAFREVIAQYKEASSLYLAALKETEVQEPSEGLAGLVLAVQEDMLEVQKRSDITIRQLNVLRGYYKNKDAHNRFREYLYSQGTPPSSPGIEGQGQQLTDGTTTPLPGRKVLDPDKAAEQMSKAAGPLSLSIMDGWTQQAIQEKTADPPTSLVMEGSTGSARNKPGRATCVGEDIGIIDSWTMLASTVTEGDLYNEKLPYKYDRSLEPDFKFTGEDDLTLFPEWKSAMEGLVVYNRSMSYGRKMLLFKKFTEGRAKHAIQWLSNDCQGFVEALKTLEHDFGEASSDEGALLMAKLGQAEELDLEFPGTIQAAKYQVREMRSKMGCGNVEAQKILEAAVFGLLSFEEETAAHWENYLAARGVIAPTLDHFDNWAQDLHRRQVRRAIVPKSNPMYKGPGVEDPDDGTVSYESSEDEDDYYKEVFGAEPVGSVDKSPGISYY